MPDLRTKQHQRQHYRDQNFCKDKRYVTFTCLKIRHCEARCNTRFQSVFVRVQGSQIECATLVTTAGRESWKQLRMAGEGGAASAVAALAAAVRIVRGAKSSSSAGGPHQWK